MAHAVTGAFFLGGGVGTVQEEGNCGVMFRGYYCGVSVSEGASATHFYFADASTHWYNHPRRNPVAVFSVFLRQKFFSSFASSVAAGFVSGDAVATKRKPL